MAASSRDMENLMIQEVEFGQKFMEWRFGAIYTAIFKRKKLVCAAKVAFIDDMNEKDMAALQAEIEALRSLQHDYILNVEMAFTFGKHIYLLTPLSEYMSCAQILMRSFTTGMDESSIGRILSQVVRALRHVSNCNLIHRGIKASHILINSSGTVKLSGFRFAIRGNGRQKKIKDFRDLENMTANHNWLAPEILEQDMEGYCCCSDVYSIGATAVELANGQMPYADASPVSLLVQKRYGMAPRLWDRKFLPSQQAEVDKDAARLRGVAKRVAESAAAAAQRAQANQPHAGPSRQENVDPSGRGLSVDDFFAQKSFSDQFRKFTESCVKRNQRPSVDDVVKHPFLRKYHFQLPKDLLKVLNLRYDPIRHETHPGTHVPQGRFIATFPSSGDIQWDFANNRSDDKPGGDRPDDKHKT